MGLCLDPKNELTIAALYPSQSLSANTNSEVIDLRDYQGRVAVIFNASAAGTGSASALDIRFMTSAESNGANATNLNINTTQVTNSGNVFETIAIDTKNCNRYLKAVPLYAGSNAFPISMSLVGQKKSES